MIDKVGVLSFWVGVSSMSWMRWGGGCEMVLTADTDAKHLLILSDAFISAFCYSFITESRCCVCALIGGPRCVRVCILYVETVGPSPFPAFGCVSVGAILGLLCQFISGHSGLISGSNFKTAGGESPHWPVRRTSARARSHVLRDGLGDTSVTV